jgi:hypothetical protein
LGAVSVPTGVRLIGFFTKKKSAYFPLDPRGTSRPDDSPIKRCAYRNEGLPNARSSERGILVINAFRVKLDRFQIFGGKPFAIKKIGIPYAACRWIPRQFLRSHYAGGLGKSFSVVFAHCNPMNH